jgi:hypothetical protein
MLTETALWAAVQPSLAESVAASYVKDARCGFLVIAR